MPPDTERYNVIGVEDEVKLAATPGGNPLTPATPLLDIPEAEVAMVISINELPRHNVGVLDGGLAH